MIGDADFLRSLAQCRCNQCENFRRLKWLGKAANGAESLCFGKHLRAAVTADKDHRSRGLILVNFFDYLQSSDVRKKQIDNNEPKAPRASLLHAFRSVYDQDYFIALRFEDQPESVAYRWFIVND
jgi:hypothetical protein